MKFCSHCGAQIDDQAVVCVHCGVSTGTSAQSVQPDAPSIGFAILSFFIPLVGLILYLIWKDKTPLRAKSCGKGALIGVCVNIGCSIISSIVLGSFLGSILWSSAVLI